MTNNEQVQQLEQALLAYCEQHAKPSTAKKILSLFNTIQTVMGKGLSIDHVVCFLHQNGIPVSKNTLKVNLYRIRKERNSNKQSTPNPKPEIEKTQPTLFPNHTEVSPLTSQPENNTDELSGEEKLKELLKRYYAVRELPERYQVLGGDPNHLTGKSISEQRNLVALLKEKVSYQLRRFGHI